jgi:ACDE family multidrug resistance protein
MEKKKTLDLLSLASIPLVMTLGNSMLIPVLPVMEKVLRLSSLQVSMIITIYSIVAIILIPIAGFLSDRLGRKVIIIPSLLIAGAGAFLSGWAAWKLNQPYMMILVGRFLQGIGAAGSFPIVLPLVGDMFKQKQDVSSGLGLIETANTFGKVVSPILGAFLAILIWYLPFFATTAFCLFSVLIVLFFVKSPKQKNNSKKVSAFWQEIKSVFVKNGRWLYSIFTIGSICMFILFGVLFYLSSLLEDRYNIDGVKKGLILAIPLAALCLTSYIAGKKIGQNQVAMKWCTFGGMALLSGSAVWFSFASGFYVSLAALLGCSIGIGAALPCLDALITEGFPKEERGTISSLYMSMRFIGVAFGPPVFALLMKNSHSLLFYLIIGLAVIAALLALFAIRPPDKKKGDGSLPKITLLFPEKSKS